MALMTMCDLNSDGYGDHDYGHYRLPVSPGMTREAD